MTKRRLGVALTALIALLCAACGARLDDEVLAAHQAGAGQGGAVATGAGTRTATTAAASATTAASGGTEAVAGTSGSAGGDGGGGGGGEAVVVGGECVPSGATDVGITESTVTLGQVSTLTGPIPGLGQTSVNGVRAYLAYLNSTGGACGRQVEVIATDDRLDTGINRSETQRLGGQVFGFVGGWAVTDDGGASVLNGTNIPDVGIAISEARAALPNNFSSNPITAGTSGNRGILQYFVDTYGIQKAAVVWGAQVTARMRAQQMVAELESLGVDVSVEREVATTETNYVPVAQAIENAGSQLVLTALEITGISRLAQSLQQVQYLPQVPYYGAQSYGDRFLETAGAAAEGTILGITHPPVEEAGSNPELARFVEWYQRVNPGAEIDFFAFQGWVAAAMFTDAIIQAGPSPTRDSVLEVLRTYTAYDAHGLVAPINPAGKEGSPCFMIVAVRGGQWVREHPPGSGFHCP